MSLYLKAIDTPAIPFYTSLPDEVSAIDRPLTDKPKPKKHKLDDSITAPSPKKGTPKPAKGTPKAAEPSSNQSTPIKSPIVNRLRSKTPGKTPKHN